MRRAGILVKKIRRAYPCSLTGYKSSFALCFSTTQWKARSDKNVVKSPLRDIPIQEVPIHEYIFQDWTKWLSRPAVVCGLTGRAYTYKDVRTMSQNLAGSLVGMGLKKESVISTVLPNTPEFPPVALGVFEAGLCLSPINFLYTPYEMVSQLKDSRSEVVVTIPERLEAVLEAKELLKSADKALGENLKVVVTPSLMGEELEAPADVVSLSELLNKEFSGRLEPVDNKSISVIPYSSGTTGLPKGVCLTHRNIVANLLQVRHEDIYDFQPSAITPDVVPCVLPVFHIYGLVSVALQTLSSGSKLVTLPRFEPTFFLKILKEHKASVLFAVPPILHFLGSSPFVTNEHLESLRIVISGAAPISLPEIAPLKAKISGVQLKQGYGLTECSPCLMYQPYGWDDFTSVGVPIANTEVKIADVATGEALPAGKRGEICGKGPQVMTGYLNNPKATSEVIDKDGFYHTGDIGYYDEKGRFYVVDRVKELIKVKAFQVAPAELEELLRTHSAIKDAAVIGVPDEKLGERPVAFISCHSEGVTPTSDSLKDFMKNKVAEYKQIDEFIFVETVERSPAGKILRKDLKKHYMTEYGKK